jgi:hypothetical protein
LVVVAASAAGGTTGDPAGGDGVGAVTGIIAGAGAATGVGVVDAGGNSFSVITHKVLPLRLCKRIEEKERRS